MRFGKNYNDVKDEWESQTDAGNGEYLRTFKEGDTELVLLHGPEEWVGYVEHYNSKPGGYSYPCTQEDDCPGCNSENPRESQRGKKIAFAALVDEKWVNVYTINRKFAEKLAKRADRDLNRRYTVTRIGMDKSTDYDVETGDKVHIDRAAYDVPNIESMLEQRYDAAWGSGKAPSPSAETSQKDLDSSEPSSESSTESTPNREFDEVELRDMTPKELKKVLRDEKLFQVAPEEIQDADDPDTIVDWMLKVVV